MTEKEHPREEEKKKRRGWLPRHVREVFHRVVDDASRAKRME